MSSLLSFIFSFKDCIDCDLIIINMKYEFISHGG